MKQFWDNFNEGLLKRFKEAKLIEVYIDTTNTVKMNLTLYNRLLNEGRIETNNNKNYLR